MTSNSADIDGNPTAKWTGWPITFASLVPLSLFIASQLGRFSFLCELISNFQVYLFWTLLPFPFLLYRLRRTRWALVLGIATVWSFVLTWTIYLPTAQPETESREFTFMSFNVLEKNPQHASTLRVIQKANPDILLVLEYSRPWQLPLSVLESEYPYRIEVPRWHGFGIALFSKFPVTDHKVFQLAAKETDNPVIFANLNIDGQTVQVVGIHVLSPINVERLRIRNDQFKELTAHLMENEFPTILAGDFNCTTWSPFLRDLMSEAQLRDSRQGFGQLPSWNARYWVARIPIDHFLISDQIQVHDRSVGTDAGGSDHFPAICRMSIGKGDVKLD